MHVSKKIILTGAAITAIGLAGTGGAALVSADTSPTSTSGQTSLVDKIASTFGLDKSKVQAVFDQDRADRQAAADKQVSADLDKLVSEGKITAAQKQLILDKRTELEKQRQADRQSMSSKTEEQREADRQSERTSLEQWAKDNGIATEYLRYVFGGPRGHHGPMAMPKSGSSSSSSTNQ